MLGELIHTETSTGLSISGLSVPSKKERAVTQVDLGPVLQLINSTQVQERGKGEQSRLEGIRQQVLACSTNSHPERLSENLLRLGRDLLSDASFASIGEAILQAVVEARLPKWQTAQHALAVNHGTGGSFKEQLTKNFRDLSHAQNLVPMVVGMAGAGLVGRGTKLLGTHLYKNLGLLKRGGELAVHAAASASGLLAEAAVFPGMHAGGALLVNQPVHLENYLGQAWDGLKLMGSLRGAGSAARLTAYSIHGISLAKAASGAVMPMATRFRSLTSLTPLALSSIYELGALMLLNVSDYPAQSLAANFSGALGTLIEFRMAGDLMNRLAPQVSVANRVLEYRAYAAVRGNSSRITDSFSKSLKGLLGGPHLGLGLSGDFRAAMAMAGSRGRVTELALGNKAISVQQRLLEARCDDRGPVASGSVQGLEQFRVSQVVREKVHIPEGYFRELKAEMDSGWSSERSPLLERHWEEFYQVVSGAVAQSPQGEFDAHATVYRLMDILYRDLLARFEEQGIGKPDDSQPTGTFASELSQFQPRTGTKRKTWETFGRVRWTALKVHALDKIDNGYVDPRAYVLSDMGRMLHHQLTLGYLQVEPFIAIRGSKSFGAKNRLVRFPHPVDLVEYLFNHGVAPGRSEEGPDYARTDLQFWVDFKPATAELAMDRIGRGRGLLLTPFYAKARHFIIRDADISGRRLGFQLFKFIMEDNPRQSHPKEGFYYDLYLGLAHSLFSEGVVADILALKDMMQSRAAELDSPDLVNAFHRCLYDFGLENKAYRKEEDFYRSYRIFFEFVVRLARNQGKAQAFRQVFSKEILNYLQTTPTEQRPRVRKLYQAFSHAVVNDRIQHEPDFRYYPNMQGLQVFD